MNYRWRHINKKHLISCYTSSTLRDTHTHTHAHTHTHTHTHTHIHTLVCTRASNIYIPFTLESTIERPVIGSVKTFLRGCVIRAAVDVIRSRYIISTTVKVHGLSHTRCSSSSYGPHKRIAVCNACIESARGFSLVLFTVVILGQTQTCLASLANSSQTYFCCFSSTTPVISEIGYIAKERLGSRLQTACHHGI
jgi:hypothetical protein